MNIEEAKKKIENCDTGWYCQEAFDTLLEEIERLNNIIKQQDTRNSRQRIANRKLLERNQDLVIENLKSNNIINELEKDLEDKYYGRGKYAMDSEVIGIKEVLNKIQELKGSDKE